MTDTKIYITFDYELFFGRTSGSVERCLIIPTDRLIDIGRRHGVVFTFFVDAGMLYAMKKFAPAASELFDQYELIAAQLRLLKHEGHSVQLHVHPHWEDSVYAEGRWCANVSRYRLNQFSQEDVKRIVSEYRAELEAVVGPGIYAFRAGGWCIQPFQGISNALRINGIKIDSTLYRDGYMNTSTHQFNFRGMPVFDTWRFEDDPMLPHPDGWFTEIPIAVTRYSRLFYFSMAFHRILKTPRFLFVGDGASVGGGRLNTLKLILNGGDGVVSLDGFRVLRLEPAYKEFSKINGNRSFVVIGHPKALCDQSFRSLDAFAETHAAKFSVM
jgi:hypothetical protein